MSSPSGIQIAGVTGHRDLDDADRPDLERAIHACLAEIESHQPTQKQCLISGLAAGSDQLVAQCALQRGWTLHAVLAATVDSFERTMPTIDAQRLRNELLPRCEEVTIVSGYVEVASMIVDCAESLIALWDGAPGRGAGGTADTVASFLQESTESNAKKKSTRSVYWVRTRRCGQPLLPPGPAWAKMPHQLDAPVHTATLNAAMCSLGLPRKDR